MRPALSINHLPEKDSGLIFENRFYGNKFLNFILKIRLVFCELEYNYENFSIED
ncbi:hypothetical protein [Leptospira borgpetersenii]|uniref:hypothetical protein n=1 Tax=Leptospira borgpetersenii TaxID=174 RepID=UPI0002DBCCFC|nr:hypothetical protein [Leptospira borgpetersenii]